MTRPQDFLLVLRVQASGRASFVALGQAIGISASQAHASAKRAVSAGLLREDYSVRPGALLEALVAIKYFIPAKRGGMARGVPTAHAAPPLNSLIVSDNEPPPVWPHGEGTVRGVVCEPIYKTAAQAALSDENLYKYLALVDALRIGRAREALLARSELERRLMKR